MDRRPPLLNAFTGTSDNVALAVAQAEETAGAWLLEQNPRVLHQTTSLAYGGETWAYVITISWVVSDDVAPSLNGARRAVRHE